QAAVGAEMCYFIENFLGSHPLAAVEAVFCVAPGAAEIASSETDENAGQSRVGGLTLERFVDFSDLHEGSWKHHPEYLAVVEFVSKTVTLFLCERQVVVWRSLSFVLS